MDSSNNVNSYTVMPIRRAGRSWALTCWLRNSRTYNPVATIRRSLASRGVERSIFRRPASGGDGPVGLGRDVLSVGRTQGGTNPQDTWSFATYWQDSASGLDYANNRYYSNAYGRFMTPDPYTNSGRLTDPQSWNRYAYTRGDPVNRADPAGTCDLAVAWWADVKLAFTNCDPSLGPDFNPSAYAQCMATPGCYTPLPGAATRLQRIHGRYKTRACRG